MPKARRDTIKMFGRRENHVLRYAMETHQFSDLKFVSHGHEFPVHKLVVCLQSPVINAAMHEGFEEAETNVIKMDSFDVETIKRFEQFLYTGWYEGFPAPIDDDKEVGESDKEVVENDKETGETGTIAPPSTPEGSEPETTVRPSVFFDDDVFQHILVNSIGDYYGVDELVSLSRARIEAILEDPQRYLVHSLPAMAEKVMEATGDRELLAVISKAMAKDIAELLASGKLDDQPHLVPPFALEVLSKSVTKYEERIAFHERRQEAFLCQIEQFQKDRRLYLGDPNLP